MSDAPRTGIFVGLAAAPSLGDLRAADRGNVIFVLADAPQRSDWPRYADALAVAMGRGAEVHTGVTHCGR